MTLESVSEQLEKIQAELISLAAKPCSASASAAQVAIAEPADLSGLAEQLQSLDVATAHRDQTRWREIGDLRGFAWKVYSQNGEDGILKEIFRRIGTTNQFFVEFGVESGVQCNTRYLVEFFEWSGVYFEPSESNFAKLSLHWQDNPRIRAVQSCITSENFESQLAAANAPHELDLLSIDIDSNDYWVWKSLNAWRPRVVVIEYNPFHDPPAKWVMKENLEYRWNQTTYFGASFTSLCALGRSKGYHLVGTDPSGVNMFFVRNDCMNEQFMDAEIHYFFQPFAYLRPPTFEGPYEEI